MISNRHTRRLLHRFAYNYTCTYTIRILPTTVDSIHTSNVAVSEFFAILNYLLVHQNPPQNHHNNTQ